MTTATAVEERLDLENIHPIWSAKYGIETCETELKKLAETEAALAEERMTILREKDTEAPGTKTRLENLEREISRLQTRQIRESDKIEALKSELPQVRREAKEQLDKLVALEERLPEVSLEVESVNAELASLLNAELVEQLTELIEKRNELGKELAGIPWLVQRVKSYFHLQPGVQEVEVSKLPEPINDLVKALSK